MSPVAVILLLSCFILLALTAVVLFLFLRARSVAELSQRDNVDLKKRVTEAEKKYEESVSRFKGVIDADEERKRVMREIESLQQQQQESSLKYEEDYKVKQSEVARLEQLIFDLRQEFARLDETANLQSFGFYTPRYGFETSTHYQLELERIRKAQKQMISDKTAAVCTTEWTVNGNRVEGRKQVNQTLKLVLRAFNGESDAAIAKVKYNNVNVMEARINKAFEAINKLITVQMSYISPAYLNLKLEELYLVHEYQEKLQQEKEEQRRIKEQMREEEIARREIEKALQDAEREEARYAEALRKAREEVEKAVGEKQAKLLAQIELLQQKLDEVHANKERAISRAQMTRSGHVYVISNVGSFGEDVYKIGMTRRLEPMDRVNELGDASVPFRFDVHAIIYCEDAPALENKLHRKFEQHRINLMNNRKEFFRVSIDEIAQAVREFHGDIEFTLLAEAKEYRQTLAYLEVQEKQAQASSTQQLSIN